MMTSPIPIAQLRKYFDTFKAIDLTTPFKIQQKQNLVFG